VDKEGFSKRRGLIWRRMAYDLCPDYFGGVKKNPEEAKRYPETMYHLGKQTKGVVDSASFDQWYEILKFRDVYKDKLLLQEILKKCKRGISGIQLRNNIKEMREQRKKGSNFDK
jgi:hypothetical protein